MSLNKCWFTKSSWEALYRTSLTSIFIINVSVQSWASWTLAPVVLSQDPSLEEVPGGRGAQVWNREAAPKTDGGGPERPDCASPVRDYDCGLHPCLCLQDLLLTQRLKYWVRT